MLYWSGKLFQTFCWPLGIGLLLLVLSRLHVRPSLRNRLFWCGWCLLVVPSLPLISNALRWSLETRFEHRAYSQVASSPAIVVFGGTMVEVSGVNRDPEELWGSRIVPAVQLAKRFPKSVVVVSGGCRYLGSDNSWRSEADDMADLMERLGVSREQIQREGRARNTYENVEFTQAILRARGIGRILLVTSALHMPRSVFLFRRKKIEVDPFPTAAEVPALSFTGSDLLPNAYALAGTTRALHEYTGNWTYRVFAWFGWLD